MGRNYPENLYTTVKYKVSHISERHMVLSFQMGSFADIDYLASIGEFLLSLSNLEFDEAVSEAYEMIANYLIGYEAVDVVRVAEVLTQYTDAPPKDILEALTSRLAWHQDLIMAQRVKTFEWSDLERYKFFAEGSRLPGEWDFSTTVVLEDNYLLIDFCGDFLTKESIEGLVFYSVSAYYVSEAAYEDSEPLSGSEMAKSKGKSGFIWPPGPIDRSERHAGGNKAERKYMKEMLIALASDGYEIGAPEILPYVANGQHWPPQKREWAFDIFPAPRPSEPWITYRPWHWSVDTSASYALRSKERPKHSKGITLWNVTDDLVDRRTDSVHGAVGAFGKVAGIKVRWSGRGSGGSSHPPEGRGGGPPPFLPVIGTGGEGGKPFGGSPLGGILSAGGCFGIKLIHDEEEDE